METVSIPYRLATNVNCIKEFLGFFEVSIPYRLATNSFFLVGTIKRLSVSIPYRLATNGEQNASQDNSKVVSIPYRLATNPDLISQPCSYRQVSIPYRLATNVLEKIKWEEKGFLFQSLIGQLQTLPFQLLYPHPYRSFNPLQVSYKQYRSVFGEMLDASFNPLQVSYKLYILSQSTLQTFMFQSLIGQLQTIRKRVI